MKKIIVLTLLSLCLSATTFADELQCKVTRWDTNAGKERICGIPTIRDNEASGYGETILEDCGISITFFSNASEDRASFGLGVLTKNPFSSRHLDEYTTFEYELGNPPKEIVLNLYTKGGGYQYKAKCVKP